MGVGWTLASPVGWRERDPLSLNVRRTAMHVHWRRGFSRRWRGEVAAPGMLSYSCSGGLESGLELTGAHPDSRYRTTVPNPRLPPRAVGW